MEIVFRQIGVIHTPIQKKEDSPIQSARSEICGRVEVFPEYLEGLDGIEKFSHIYLLYHLNQAGKEISLRVKPFLDDKAHGVFATRYPVRPNAIGLSIVRLERIEANVLFFIGADILDQTPLLDIKPYISEFDVFEVTQKGWYSDRKYD